MQARGRVRLLEREMTRCVDPTEAMKAMFSSAPVGNCHSAKPEKVANQYIFSKRCDYMGPVSTVVTVQSDEAYTEVNELTVGKMPRTELVVAQRIGDCLDDAKLARRSDSLSQTVGFVVSPLNLALKGQETDKSSNRADPSIGSCCCLAFGVDKTLG